MDTDTCNTLEQALTEMSHQQLLNLTVQLSKEQADFRRILLAHVDISPQILQQQFRDKQAVAQFKRAASNFFNDLEDRAGYDHSHYDREYDEGEEYPELDSILKDAKTLNPADQLEVFWHILTYGNKIFEQEEFYMGTPQIEEAISLYAQTATKLELTPQEKQFHFDLLIDALSWEMCGYGDVSDSLEKALKTICTTDEDYHYLISQFQNSDYEKASDLMAEYYLKVGDDQSYLRIRQANLVSEPQYLELADYWQQKGNPAKSIDTLEQWVVSLAEKKNQSGTLSSSLYPPYFSAVSSSVVLQRLANYYRQQQDLKNLCRILMTMAEYSRVTLDLYKQLKTVSIELGSWEELQPMIIEFAQRDSHQLAEIYLYEQDWDAAVQLAQQKSNLYLNESLNILVAEGVKEHRTEASIQLYQQLVHDHIERKNRDHYRIAARHARAIQSIYISVLKDSAAWQRYITGLRQNYPRHRALQEELQDL